MSKRHGLGHFTRLFSAALIVAVTLQSVPSQAAVSDPNVDAVLGLAAIPASVGLIPQWAQMMGRFDGQVVGQGRGAWNEVVGRFAAMDVGSAIAAVNQYVNRTDYVADNAGWHQPDYWETPFEFFARGGDCEDYAIAKFLILKALGVPASSMRILMLRGRGGDEDHSVLLVQTGSGALILDNLRNQPYRYGNNTASQVAYAFNDQGMWLTVGN